METDSEKVAREEAERIASEAKSKGDGVQARIDFLTAKSKTLEEDNAALKQRIEEGELILEESKRQKESDDKSSSDATSSNSLDWSNFQNTGPQKYTENVASQITAREIRNLELKIEADKVGVRINDDVSRDPIISKFFTNPNDYRKELDRIVKEDGINNLTPSQRYNYASARLSRDLIQRSTSDAESRRRISSVFTENGSTAPIKTVEEIKNEESNRHMADGAKSSEGYTVEDYQRENPVKK